LPKAILEDRRRDRCASIQIDEVIADPKAPLDQRLAVLPLLASRKWDAVKPVVEAC